MKLPEWFRARKGIVQGVGSERPQPPYRDLCSDSRERVYATARRTALEKYRRKIAMDDPDNIKRGVTLPDCLLVGYYWHAQDMMERAGVGSVEALTGHDKAVLGLMAIAFDLDDAAYEAICARLTPGQVEKAQVFRGKWVSAHKTEPRMEEIRRDALRRATEARAAQEKAFEALHQEPDPATAYEIGCRQLLSGELLGQEGQSCYFLLPFGVVQARAEKAKVRPDWTSPPPYADLTREEKAILSHLHQLMAHVSDVGVRMDLMVKRPQVDIETNAFAHLAGAFVGKTILRADLPSGPYQGGLAFDTCLFQNVMAHHVHWRIPRPLDLEDKH